MSILKKLDEAVIFDLEATCEDKLVDFYFDNEIIEIGAVKIKGGRIVDEFNTFIRPRDTVITPFCTELTTITAEDVWNAPDFVEVSAAFGTFIGNARSLSWGDYDRKQLLKDFARHDVVPPFWMKRHINLKQEFADLLNIQRCGMKKALALCGIELEGTHHRGIDDARNIAKIYLYLKDNYYPNKWGNLSK
ncbi:MAG: 3'-5' exonuclease [Solibacillus sp.]